MKVLSHFWNNLEPFDQDFLRIKCEDGLVYQHVLRAYPTHVKGKSIELQKDTEDEARIFQERAQALHALITSLEELKQAHALAEKKWSEEKAQLNQNIEQLNQNIEQLNQNIEQLAVALNHSQATLAWTEDQLKNHKDSLQEVLSSASWKLTKPLRALKR